jgi:2-polyprenyl-6-methoxyphenol hydroxylase-like FAD-dependent oxidoreductase
LFTTGKLLFYPIRNNIDGDGNQLINWVVELFSDKYEPADWSRLGDVNEVLPHFASWRFDWFDPPAIMRNADFVLTYPMVDRDPIEQWTFDRVTLLGDAAHPMYPRGGNGGAQSILDAAALTRHLVKATSPLEALCAYEAERLAPTRAIVLQNRTAPPDLIIDTVEQRANKQKFDRLEDVISREELMAISQNYQQVAGWDRASLKAKTV